MLWAWFAGAATAGALDFLLSPGLAASPLPRETVWVVLFGNLLLASLAGMALRLARLRVSDAAAFLAAASLALAPLLAQWLDSAGLAMAASALLGGGLLWLSRDAAAPRPLARGLGAAAVGALVLVAATHPTLLPMLPNAPRASAERDRRPDLLLLSIDTLRADAVPGDPACTPNLARLASSGVTADYALAPSSLTLPSHVTLLSGRPLDEHGVTDNQGIVPAAPLVSERLKDGGYRTAAVVSNYLVRGDAGFARGVEVYDDAPVVHAGPVERFREQVARSTWWGWSFGPLPAWLETWLLGGRFPEDGDRENAKRTTHHALHLLRQLQDQAAPYYLFVHYMDPHDPYAPGPNTRCGDEPESLDSERADWRALRRIARDLGEGTASAEAARAAAKALYDREVRTVDRALGELLAQVERGGRPTVVLLTADHGEQFGDHGLMTHGDSVYEAGLRVPFVLTGPGIPVRRLAHPPQLIDVAPTLLALAGLERTDLPGLDLSRELPGPRPHLARAGSHAALRDAQGFKLVTRLDGRGAPARLYALETDPSELRDRRREEPARFGRLEQELHARATAHESEQRDHSREHLSALEALGYVD